MPKLKNIFIIFTLFVFINTAFAATSGFPKEYYKMKATIKKQQYFFNYLYPHIETANKNILKDREFIKSLNLKKDLTIDSIEYKKLSKIQKKYAIKEIYDYPKYLKKIDVVPASMALAQAAVESGWGQSRFVKEGNNLFGHWTYGKKGIVPLRREKGAKHLVRIFDSFEDSISAYMLNLNRSRAYHDFRNKRAQSKKNNENPSGLILSQTMIKYSGIGKKYLWILKRMIKSNKLDTFDIKLYKNLTKVKNEL